MFPFYPMPQQPQKSIKDQLQDAEEMLNFFQSKFEKKDDTKPKAWYQYKVSIWELAVILLVGAFCAALPTTLWIIHELAAIKAAILAL